MEYFKLKIALIGISGKMGKTIKTLISKDSKTILKGGINKKNISSIPFLIQSSDVVIDFSSPFLLKDLLSSCLKHKKPLVIGTTGYNKKQILEIKKSSKKIPIMFSSNYSLGIAICRNIIKKATLLSKDLFSLHISETHHLEKKDSPSGTALSISFDIKNILKKEPPIDSYRIKDIVGKHSVSFFAEEEEFQISHTAKKRTAFAKGAIFSAKYIYKKSPFLYSFENLFK